MRSLRGVGDREPTAVLGRLHAILRVFGRVTPITLEGVRGTYRVELLFDSA